MRPAFLVSALGALLLALIYLPDLLSTFLIIGVILAATLGVAAQITAHVSFGARSHFSSVYTKPTSERKTLHRLLMVSTNFYHTYQTRCISFWWCINVTLTILNIIHHSVYYLKHDLSETGFIMFWIEDWMMDNVHNCVISSVYWNRESRLIRLPGIMVGGMVHLNAHPPHVLLLPTLLTLMLYSICSLFSVICLSLASTVTRQ
jgi:hypothetical protein